LCGKLALLWPALFLAGISSAHAAPPDLASDALVSVFQRDNGKLVCSPGNVGLSEMNALLAPFIEGIDKTDQKSYPALAKAVYVAFPCPFSPLRAELRPAEKEDLAGAWAVPESSIRLRYPPGSPAWQSQPGLPQLKCEGILFDQTGEYRVAQVRGQFECPTSATLAGMRQLPRVSSWEFLGKGRVRITRTDVPTHFEEWEIHVVRERFSFASTTFAPGDMVAYLRRVPGNEIGASTLFRHMQPLQ
jgi:hypothetical protein